MVLGVTDLVLRHDTTCRICDSYRIERLYELMETPLEDQYLPLDRIDESAQRYPLELALCANCSYLHLPHIIEPQHNYERYLYVTSSTAGLPNHYLQYAKTILSNFNNSTEIFVVDLGSNDGTMLKAFQVAGVKKILGVEPNKQIAYLANQQVPTINSYFDKACVLQIQSLHGKPDLISANYMLANIDDLHKFLQNVVELLSSDGLLVFETGYHPEQMKRFMFDYIYHEHYSYFSVRALEYLFAHNHLEILDVQLHQPKGGAIRVTAQHMSGPRPISPNVKTFITNEEESGIYLPTTYHSYFLDLEKIKNDLTILLDQVRNSNETIVGYGASHSTTTLIHHFELSEYIDFIVDDNPAKQNLYSPGYHIPVRSPMSLKQENPDWILILGWQHASVIRKRIVDIVGPEQKVIIPLPSPKKVFSAELSNVYSE